MIERLLVNKVKKLLLQFPAVAILGARQVGKTTLAKYIEIVLSRDVIHLDLEKSIDRSALENNPELYFEINKEKCIVIDEIQRMPHLFAVLRPSIDEYRIPGRFLLLGSASPHLLKGTSESLAGRIAYTELTTLNALEIPKERSIKDLWLSGGFPEPFLSSDQEYIKEWYNYFLATYFERDLRLLGLQAEPTKLSRLFSMIAHMQGSPFSVNTIAKSIGMDRRTIEKYTQFFISSYMVRCLLPFHINSKKRLVKSPKFYFRDSGLFHCVLNINSVDMLLRHPLIGASWEGFVLEQITTVFDHLTPYFYRTQAGAECDLVLVSGNEPVACIEAKMSSSPKMTKSLTTAIKDLGTKKNFVVVPVCETPYNLSEKTIVCDLKFMLSMHKSF